MKIYFDKIQFIVFPMYSTNTPDVIIFQYLIQKDRGVLGRGMPWRGKMDCLGNIKFNSVSFT